MNLGLSAPEQRILLEVARRAVEHVTGGGTVDEAWLSGAPVVGANGSAGAFVSLHRRADGELRGCIGFIPSRWGLVETVARAAEGAASRDPRFPPVDTIELPGLRLDVSVLGPPYPIRPEEVVVGRHGLIVDDGVQHGLLLPQVPVEWGWDRETFLDQLCRKAGLPKTSWRDPKTALSAFEAVVFAET